MVLFVVGQVCFQALGKLASCKHNTPAASFAFKPDVRAEPRDGPFVGAARVLFTEAQVVVETQVRKHVSIQ
jgi:hypothetical protein